MQKLSGSQKALVKELNQAPYVNNHLIIENSQPHNFRYAQIAFQTHLHLTFGSKLLYITMWKMIRTLVVTHLAAESIETLSWSNRWPREVLGLELAPSTPKTVLFFVFYIALYCLLEVIMVIIIKMAIWLISLTWS